ncbi:hypothetical protein [Nitrosomonas sp.]|uniref:hypothetical protein n=1 Tax=Nitrosomonas sp. TaxID=42353 RepID=UPI00374D857A
MENSVIEISFSVPARPNPDYIPPNDPRPEKIPPEQEPPLEVPPEGDPPEAVPPMREPEIPVPEGKLQTHKIEMIEYINLLKRRRIIMDKKTDIVPNDHSPCVEPMSPRRISPEDIPNEAVISKDAPPRKNVPEESYGQRIQTKSNLPLKRSFPSHFLKME